MDKYPWGVILADGGVLWVVDDIRDSVLVGSVKLDYVLRTGSVKANGALLQRSSYPRLFKWVQDNAAVQTTEASWSGNKHLYTLGDGSTTFRVPDLRGQWLQTAENIGLLSAGLPNITGVYNSQIHMSGVAATYSGAFTAMTIYNYPVNVNDIAPGAQLTFDASRSNPVYGNSTTVQPPSVQLIAQIKY